MGESDPNGNSWLDNAFDDVFGRGSFNQVFGDNASAWSDRTFGAGGEIITGRSFSQRPDPALSYAAYKSANLEGAQKIFSASGEARSSSAGDAVMVAASVALLSAEAVATAGGFAKSILTRFGTRVAKEGVGIAKDAANTPDLIGPHSTWSISGGLKGINTNVTAEEFVATLRANGYTATTRAGSNGSVTVLRNGQGSTYTVYTRTSTGAGGFQYFGSDGQILKYNFTK